MEKKVLNKSTSLRVVSNSDIKASLKGMVGGGGIDAANTAADYVDAMKKAYDLGKEL